VSVVVAMSGGVDSSVAAALLHEAGHHVIGVTLQLSGQAPAQGRARSCCAGRDVLDARQVAEQIGIAHYVIDAEQRFRDSVVQDFADSYARGETPVPCVRCNQGVKFTDLLGLARSLGAEALATGHYVRRVEGADGPELHQPLDLDRDQSWFMFATTPSQLAFTRFPLGELASKARVRDEARRLGLTVAEKADSQDICFVPDRRYAEAVGRLRPEALEQGEIVSASGAVLGRHDGIARYTVGQASRLNLPQSSGERPVVIGIEAASRRIVVGSRDAGSRRLRLREVNWLGRPGTSRVTCQVRLRARDEMRDAVVRLDGDTAEVELDVATLAAPGQGCVFYEGSRILGGGFICRQAA
jgi:tRNA-specific 2-thiouridylase